MKHDARQLGGSPFWPKKKKKKKFAHVLKFIFCRFGVRAPDIQGIIQPKTYAPENTRSLLKTKTYAPIWSARARKHKKLVENKNVCGLVKNLVKRLLFFWWGLVKNLVKRYVINISGVLKSFFCVIWNASIHQYIHQFLRSLYVGETKVKSYA